MIPAEFDYVKATSVDQAVAALAEHGDEAKLLGGGQSLLPLLRLRLSYPTVVIDICKVDEMRGVREEGDRLVVGAMTTHDEVLKSGLVQQHLPLLLETTQTVADPAVRHKGTFGGALAHADPAGDLAAAAVALDATMTIAGPNGRRQVGAGEFFVDYLQSVLEPDEVLVEVSMPKLGEGWGVHYEKFHRVAQAWAIVGVAAAVKRSNGSIAEARIGLTNMGSTPVRARATEQALAGASADAGAIKAAAAKADEGTDPPVDLNGQADYRRHLAQVLTARAVTKAAGL
ncbi:MAG: aerobic carbon-monoxide dehydrogenase medium subunit [Frankiaceae bacterium]|jgi:carbon-monoxide dehydrogenase medium subunit|nr:aerobic carbon-monoxide dehydrogenase medium subunit [Frankiaceae bacterium]MDQ1634646.1 aerobic carbon-monoxide dehydrogenase medium subunit [Frankiaceae bacterium]